MSGGDRIEVSDARQLAELARDLQSEPDMTGLLQGIVSAAVVNIPGADHAGITQFRDHRRSVNTVAATDDLVEQVDRLQYETDQGPCLDAIRDQLTVRSDDLSMDPRWPLFAERAAAVGVHSVLAFQLYVEDHELGVLNLYSTKVGAFSDRDETIGLLLASHAAVALIGAEKQHHLRIGLDSRDIIGQAKGMLMERYQIGALQAFAVLVRLSQDNNRRLIDIADDITRTGNNPNNDAVQRFPRRD